MKASSIAHGLLVLPVLALLTCGCVTPALWRHTAAREWRAQSSPDQFLFTTTTCGHDVLVVFRQSTGEGSRTKERLVAWNPHHQPSELIVGPNALRQLTNACERVQLMPVFQRDSIPGSATSTPPGYVVVDQCWSGFTVHVDTIPSGPFELPASHEKTRSLMRIAGTPFAIVADAALVGVVVVGLLIHGTASGEMGSVQTAGSF